MKLIIVGITVLVILLTIDLSTSLHLEDIQGEYTFECQSIDSYLGSFMYTQRTIIAGNSIKTILLVYEDRVCSNNAYLLRIDTEASISIGEHIPSENWSTPGQYKEPTFFLPQTISRKVLSIRSEKAGNVLAKCGCEITSVSPFEAFDITNWNCASVIHSCATDPLQSESCISQDYASNSILMCPSSEGCHTDLSYLTSETKVRKFLPYSPPFDVQSVLGEWNAVCSPVVGMSQNFWMSETSWWQIGSGRILTNVFSDSHCSNILFSYDRVFNYSLGLEVYVL